MVELHTYTTYISEFSYAVYFRRYANFPATSANASAQR